MNMTTIGTRLRLERQRLGKTQTEMADIGGVRKNAQSHYENDSNAPDTTYLERIAKAGVDIHFLFYGEYSDAAAKGQFNDLLAALYKLSPEQQAKGFGLLSMLGSDPASPQSSERASAIWRAVRLYNLFLTLDEKHMAMVEGAANMMQLASPDSSLPEG